MCAILGAILTKIDDGKKLREANRILLCVWNKSHERGRDGRGFLIDSSNEMGAYTHRSTSKGTDSEVPCLRKWTNRAIVIGNTRAEPTTEYVARKLISDVQPYSLEGWSIVHNGTIANDADIRTYKHVTTIDSAAIVEVLAECDNDFDGFVQGVKKLRGSYAILATRVENNGRMYVAANYRPIWYIETNIGTFFASSREYFPAEYNPVMIEPYTACMFDVSGLRATTPLRDSRIQGERALVICSGGLDSVVSAAYAKSELGMGIHLIHFLYGSRAEGPEVEAVRKVAEFLNAELTLFPLAVYSKGDSPLLDPDSKVAGGEAGAEFAHEWVPARNLLLLSVATAFAEARGIDTLVLGNNLEEAGAYPDNEPEFIAKFNDLLPFAVGDGKRMRVIMPVGNLMKHEIVELGKRIEAPMHLTWSCYRAGEEHCGVCGPCYMRRKAFEINGFPEVITYKDTHETDS